MSADPVIHFTGAITDDGKQLLIDYPDALKADYKFLAGHAIEGTIRKQRSKRSLQQNRYFHKVIEPLAEHLGATTEELKLDLLGETFGWQETKRGNKLPNELHTSGLNTQQFGELIDTLLRIAAEESIVILLPDEWKALQKKAAKQLRRGTGRVTSGGDRTTRSHAGSPQAEANSASASEVQR